tara:strand:- start:1014 stop:1241 length:228 start_codon:yes stop_codon:yes gene_type:complete
MEVLLVIYDCKICKKEATIMVQTGTLKLLEIRDISGEMMYDWTGGGGLNHYLCDSCFDGLHRDLWNKGGVVLDSY